MDLYINDRMIEDLEQLKDCFKSSDLNVRNELLSYIRNGSLAEWLSEGNSPEEAQMADAVSGLDYESDDVMLWRNVYEIIVGGECGKKVPSYSDCFELVSISSKNCIILEGKILPNVTPIIYLPKDIEVEMCFKFNIKKPKYASVNFCLSRFLKSKPLGSISLRKEGTVELCAKLLFNENEISQKNEDKSSKPQTTTENSIINLVLNGIAVIGRTIVNQLLDKNAWLLKHYDENWSITIKRLLIKECSQKVFEQYMLAKEGDAVAQKNLGYYFGNGQGIDQSYTEALKWYRKSAEQGNASAQYNLGICYERGLGVEQSHSEAVKWLRKSAEQQYALAIVKLIVMGVQ